MGFVGAGNLIITLQEQGDHLLSGLPLVSDGNFAQIGLTVVHKSRNKRLFLVLPKLSPYRAAIASELRADRDTIDTLPSLPANWLMKFAPRRRGQEQGFETNNVSALILKMETNTFALMTKQADCSVWQGVTLVERQFGLGRGWTFICPITGRKVSKLYFRGDLWASRHAFRLGTSTRTGPINRVFSSVRLCWNQSKGSGGECSSGLHSNGSIKSGS